MHDIYFDSAATTKPCAAAVEAAVKAMEEYGNPSSTHFRGMSAKKIIENARSIIASALGCGEDEFIFTGSGSESNNLAVIGAARARKRRSNVIVSTDSEHPSVAKPLEYLESEGFQVVRLSTKSGKLDIDELREALSQKVALVTIMRANNETGALYDIAAVRREIDNSGCGALFHCDAVQGFLKTPNRSELTKYCDLVSVSAHKINALKGCGGLYVKKGINLQAIILGGGHERGLRSGTENTPAIAAFGAACREWTSNKGRVQYITDLRDYAEQRITDVLGDNVVIHRPPERICAILSIALPGVKSEVALNYLSGEGICISAGSACSSHHKDSGVLTAFGLKKEEVGSTLRISFSYTNTKEEVDLLAEYLRKAADTFKR
jgi:cysteine desulfurase